MQRQTLSDRSFITSMLILQIIPLLLFPAGSFSPKTQEWWLPALLAVMALIATAELTLRGGDQPWPWYLISFAHGFNIISRLMMVWPHATKASGGADVLYIVLTILAMALSAGVLWYTEIPDVRVGLLRQRTPPK
jgi:hypothetical protein